MNCPRCNALIAAADVNLEHLLAKCRGCNEVFKFSPAEIEAVSAGIRAGEPPLGIAPGPIEPDLDIRVRRVRAPRPASIEVEDWGGQRRLVKRWFNWTYIGTACFCVFWDGFLVVWYSVAFTQGGPWLMVLFPLLHVAVGVGITYSTLAGFLNRTEITLVGDDLEVRHGPLPWLGSATVKSDTIDQLYCMDALPLWNNRNQTYRPQVALCALLKSGASKRIVNALPREEGLFIEQQLEEWLQIAPRRVPGQVD